MMGKLKHIALGALLGGALLWSGAAFALTAGTAYITQTKVDYVHASGGQATSAAGSVSYQWYVSTTLGVNGSPASGATEQDSVIYQLTGGTTYYISLQYYDGTSTVYSNQVMVTTLASTQLINIGGIGDSIMAGPAACNSNPPMSVMTDILNDSTTQWEFEVPSGANQAIGGTSSNQWISGSTDLANAESVFNNGRNITLLIIMLGTNDAFTGSFTPEATYKSNIQSTIADIFANVPSIKYINIYSSPFLPLASTGATGLLNQESNEALIWYDTQLSAIANGSTVFHTQPLDTYNYIQTFPSDIGGDGVHPTATGCYAYGGLWAMGILRDTAPFGAFGGRLLFR